MWWHGTSRGRRENKKERTDRVINWWILSVKNVFTCSPSKATSISSSFHLVGAVLPALRTYCTTREQARTHTHRQTDRHTHTTKYIAHVICCTCTRRHTPQKVAVLPRFQILLQVHLSSTPMTACCPAVSSCTPRCPYNN